MGGMDDKSGREAPDDAVDVDLDEDTDGDEPTELRDKLKEEIGSGGVPGAATDADDATEVDADPDEWADGDEEVSQRVQLSNDESAPDDGSVMDDVDDEEVEDAMGEIDLEIRDDIDPEHFDYEDQDFDQFGAYGQQANIEYNGAVFLFEQPKDRVQQQLVNEMQEIDRDEDAGSSEMMDLMIEHTITRPREIESVVADWSPFERLGLGLYCLEFNGLGALGNI